MKRKCAKIINKVQACEKCWKAERAAKNAIPYTRKHISVHVCAYNLQCTLSGVVTRSSSLLNFSKPLAATYTCRTTREERRFVAQQGKGILLSSLAFSSSTSIASSLADFIYIFFISEICTFSPFFGAFAQLLPVLAGNWKRYPYKWLCIVCRKCEKAIDKTNNNKNKVEYYFTKQ